MVVDGIKVMVANGMKEMVRTFGNRKIGQMKEIYQQMVRKQ